VRDNLFELVSLQISIFDLACVSWSF